MTLESIIQERLNKAKDHRDRLCNESNTVSAVIQELEHIQARLCAHEYQSPKYQWLTEEQRNAYETRIAQLKGLQGSVNWTFLGDAAKDLICDGISRLQKALATNTPIE